MNTKETNCIKLYFSKLNRQEKIVAITESPLNDIEAALLIKRFINGISLKECSDIYGIEINSVSKKQQKAVRKLYQYLFTK